MVAARLNFHLVIIIFSRKSVAQRSSCVIPEVEPGVFLCALTLPFVSIELHYYFLFLIVRFQYQVDLGAFLCMLTMPSILSLLHLKFCFLNSPSPFLDLWRNPWFRWSVVPNNVLLSPCMILLFCLGPCVALVFLYSPAPCPIMSLLASQPQLCLQTP